MSQIVALVVCVPRIGARKVVTVQQCSTVSNKHNHRLNLVDSYDGVPDAGWYTGASR
jgi:hypothetical protein